MDMHDSLRVVLKAHKLNHNINSTPSTISSCPRDYINSIASASHSDLGNEHDARTLPAILGRLLKGEVCGETHAAIAAHMALLDVALSWYKAGAQVNRPSHAPSLRNDDLNRYMSSPDFCI